MKRKKRLFFVLLCFISVVVTRSQDKEYGKLSGKVTDAETGEVIVGVNIMIEGTKLGAATDLDGYYSIIVSGGTYNLLVSALSYTKKKITDVKVENGQDMQMYIVLNSDAIKTYEVVVEAKANTSYEAVMLTKQKNAPTISDGISAEQIKRTVDATTGDAIRRLAGVTLMDNKYVFVRGTTDRYNLATLNGAIVPSTDPDKKSFSFDMLPSNLLDNTVVVKSATPDLRGDFSGGLVQMSTLDFPVNFLFKISAGTTSNATTTGRTFLSQQGGRLDWLGIDDGTRIHDLPGHNDNDLLSFFKSIPNRWGTVRQTAPLSNSFSLALGDGITLGSTQEKDPSEIGFIGAFSYRNSYQHTDFSQFDWTSNRVNEGPKDNFSVLWSGIANISYSYRGLHRISFKNNYTQSGEQEIVNNSAVDNQNGRNNLIYLSTWTQRSIYSGQFSGEHQFPSFLNMKIEWHVSFSNGEQQIPDKQQTNYSQLIDQPADPFVLDLGRRSWTSLHDRNRSYGLDFLIPLSSMKLKTGLLTEKKKTDYDVRSFEFLMDWTRWSPRTDLIGQMPLDSIFALENIGSGMVVPRASSKPSDTYWGNSILSAAYFMADIPFTFYGEKFRWIGGMRIENYSLDLTIPLTTTHTESTLAHHVDYLPSMNLTYHILENANVRIAFSKTLNRPEFRELARSDIYDWIKLVYEYGNPDLKQATILNSDIRFELFPSTTEIYAVSYFRKIISNAIEQVAYFEPSRVLSWRNATSDALCSGWELEIKKNFAFITSYLANFSISGNYSRIFSSVEFHDAAVNFSRPLQGQSPYVINAMATFQEPTVGTTISLSYNKFGERLIAVGSKYGNRYISLYEEPRDLVDLTINQPFVWGLELKASVKNIAGKDRIIHIDKEDAGIFKKVLYEQVHYNPNYSIQLSKSF